MTAATRRAAYRRVASLIEQNQQQTHGWTRPIAMGDAFTMAMLDICDAMNAACLVEDGPGVAGQDKTNTNGVR